MSITRYLLSGLMLASGLAMAEIPTHIPEALQPWVEWVRKDQPDHQCPRIAQQPQQRRCAWPGELSIDVSANGARFTQHWVVYGASNIILPGDARHWPVDVQLNNQPAVVLDIKGKPAVKLTAGAYRLSGNLTWQKPPQFLPVAQDTALIKLHRDGEILATQIDKQGRLWLREQRQDSAPERNSDTLKAEVFRLLSDDIPLYIDTELRLAVAGKPREIVLGQLLPDQAEPVTFNSPLPARIEANGSLRIQARAGEWRITLRARYLTAPSDYRMRKLDAYWPDQEIWSFRANPQLRGVKLSGLPAVDPSQINIPPRFANLPTYLMNSEQTLSLEQQYRGDASPAANRLSLKRTLWLDFDGRGATTRDDIRGTFSHRWRLHSSQELKLGRVVANGEPQLVTHMPGEAGAGIEIRHPQVIVEAVSRIAPLSAVSAHGWLHDFDKVDLELRLPPGWQLWHAAGPDRVRSSWLSQWDLWDLFICLLIVGGLLRIINWQWGLIGAITLTLTYHESGAPLLAWALLVGALPLLTVLPDGRPKQLVNAIAHLTLAALIVIVIAFAVQQVRKGIYPQLEQTRAINAGPYNYPQGRVPAASPEQGRKQDVASATSVAKIASELDSSHRLSEEKQRYRPTDNVQTGPGEPSWRWRQEHLSWSGPVKADATLQLYLSPPWLTRTLRFVQVVLTVLLLYGLGGRLIRHHWLFGEANNQRGDANRSPAGITSTILLPLIAASAVQLMAPEAQAQTFPPKSLLQELQATLGKAPDCAPQCAAVQRTQIALTDNRLILRQRVSSAAEIAFPLPADKSWQITALLVNGESLPVAQANNRLWVRLPAGSHDITLTATVAGDHVGLAFPLTPHNTSVTAPGWQVLGLVDGRVAGGALQLEKEIKQIKQDTLLPAPIKPFVQIERQLNADIDWQLVTTVTRIAPANAAINLRVPLIDGESVVSQNVLTENQRVVIALGAKQHQVQWRSVLEPKDQLALTAADTSEWVEHWRILASPRWHIRGEGIAPIKNAAQGEGGPVIQLWRPWPGESLTLNAVQPLPVLGPTTTVESAELDHRPGARSAALQLSLGIRTSIGGEYRIAQPAGAELQSMVVDGVEQTSPREDEFVVIPLHPGLQNVVINWELDSGVALTTTTPSFVLPTPASNIDVKLQLPRDRWPILLSGPDIGPAMLYWGVLAVILVIAVGLGNIVKRQDLSMPINTWQWLLLALGMSTVNMAGSIVVVIWFFAMEARRRRPLPLSSERFNVTQVGLIALSIIALISLFYTIPQSLLSAPNMQVTGNGSNNYVYQWYQDHSVDALPQGWVLSLPLVLFRIAMLLWSLWIVFALLRWMKWGWECLSTGQLWNSKPPRRARRAPKSQQPAATSED